MSTRLRRGLNLVSTTLFFSALFAAAIVLLGTGCESDGNPVETPICDTCDTQTVCDTCDTSIIGAERIAAMPASEEELTGISFDRAAISNSVGERQWKLAVCHDRRIYLLSSENDTVWRISQGNEAWDGGEGRPHSPLFSHDGRYIAFSGELFNSKKIVRSFVQEAVAGTDSVWRIQIAPELDVVSEPHWFLNPATNRPHLYFVDSYKAVEYNSTTSRIEGTTYQVILENDSVLSAPSSTDLPGAFKGGFSKDGNWAATAYASAALYRMNTGELTVLGCGKQYCNPSINPYPAGSNNTDYMVMLGFGNIREKDTVGCKSFVTVAGDTLYEGQHHNLWMFNADGRVVWRAERPEGIQKIEKPEWSTHPRFATAVLRRDVSQMLADQCDLYIISIPNLADADRAQFVEAAESDFIKIGSGGFSALDWTHLWVE